MEDCLSVDDNGGELHCTDDNGQVIAGVAQYVGDVGGCTCGGIEFYAVQFLHGDDQFYVISFNVKAFYYQMLFEAENQGRRPSWESPDPLE